MGNRLLLIFIFIIAASGLSGCGTPGYMYASQYNGMPKSERIKTAAKMRRYCPINKGFTVGMVYVYFNERGPAITAPPGFFTSSPLEHYIYACYKRSPTYFYKPCPPHSYRPGYGDVCVYNP